MHNRLDLLCIFAAHSQNKHANLYNWDICIAEVLYFILAMLNYADETGDGNIAAFKACVVVQNDNLSSYIIAG